MSARRRAKVRLGMSFVLAVIGPPPSRGLLRKVLERETLGLDFGWLKWCVKWCSPACAGLLCLVRFYRGCQGAWCGLEVGVRHYAGKSEGIPQGLKPHFVRR